MLLRLQRLTLDIDLRFTSAAQGRTDAAKLTQEYAVENFGPRASVTLRVAGVRVMTDEGILSSEKAIEPSPYLAAI